MLKLLGGHDQVELGSPMLVTRVVRRGGVLLLRLKPTGAEVHPSGQGWKRAHGDRSVPTRSRSTRDLAVLQAVACESPRRAGGSGAGAGPRSLWRSRGRRVELTMAQSVSVKAASGLRAGPLGVAPRDAGRGRHPLHRRLGGGIPDQSMDDQGCHIRRASDGALAGGVRVLARAPKGLVTCPALLFGVLVGVVVALVATALVASAPLLVRGRHACDACWWRRRWIPLAHAGVVGGRHV